MTLVYDDIWHMSALVSQGCHNKALQTRVSKHQKSALTALEGGSLKSRCRHGPALAPKALEENPFFLLQLLEAQASLGLWLPRSNIRLCLHADLHKAASSGALLSHKDTGHCRLGTLYPSVTSS